MDKWSFVPFGKDIRRAVERKRRRKELDQTREMIEEGAQNTLVKRRLERRAEIDEETGKVKPRYVQLREESGYDYAAKCIRCGALMPINYTRSFMGKCVDCAENKERADILEFRQTMMKRFVIALLGGVLQMIICGFLARVKVPSLFGFLPMYIEKYRPLKSVLYLVFVVMDFAMLADFVKSKASAAVEKRLNKEVVSLGYLLLLIPGDVDEYTVIFLGFTLLIAILLRVRKYYKVKDYLKKYRMDTVAFRGRILRDDEQRAKEEAAGAITGEKAPEEGNAPESGNAPEKGNLPERGGAAEGQAS